jgi:hypothetical protein
MEPTMQNMAADILTAEIAAFPDAACTFRHSRSEWSGMCAGMNEIKAATDQGQVAGYSGNARYLSADEPTTIDAGEVIEVKRAQDADWLKLRVAARYENGGAVQLTIAAEFA